MPVCADDVGIRSIPAWAGEPLTAVPRGWLFRVYPRVGGGTSGLSAATLTLNGLSPRGRGNPGQENEAEVDRRSIPAWAGEPTRRAIFSASAKVYPRVGGGTHKASDFLGLR